MGFWHTGYIEFHEATGIQSVLKPIQYPCNLCNEIFMESEQLRNHRFESHRLTRPTLFIRGKEVGSQVLSVVRKLNVQDITLGCCEKVILNGQDCAVNNFPEILSMQPNGTHTLHLEYNGVVSKFNLDFMVASDEHIAGVENVFCRIVTEKKLSLEVVTCFIESAKQYNSAIRYCDGISNYLYGVLLKEGSTEAHHSFEEYVKKFNAAADALADYDRPLARIITALIAFHFNQFSTVVSFADGTGLSLSASRFISWLEGADVQHENYGKHNGWEHILTDRETEQIIEWTAEFSELDIVEPLENSLKTFRTEFDRNKLRVLLSELYKRLGRKEDAVRYAKEIRSIQLFEKWADKLINEHK